MCYMRASEITAEEFVKRRKALGLGVTALAYELGITRNAVQKIEARAMIPVRYVLALQALEAMAERVSA